MGNINYYEPRFIRNINSKSIDQFFDNKNNSKTLKDYIFQFNKIILLGNPGIGKTKELDNLFEELWNEKDDTGLIPLSINLKHFRKIDKLDDLILYKEWKKLPSVIFILDGLDEIAEISDFLSAFELFISQNKALNIKYIISCRTNIYDKYLVNISEFEIFYLDYLTLEQDESILKNKYDIDFNKINLNEKYLDFLKTPFFLKLFAEYYIQKNLIPQSELEIWELFISKTIDEHQLKQLKRQIISPPKLINELSKVAFVNELMQKNYVTENELYKIIGEKYNDFLDNPFINELKDDSKKWNFVHRQIQEYFVARILSEKNFQEILEIITITNLNIVHPSLFNTISFLINLIDKKSTIYKDLINWIEINQIELIIRADSNRIDNDLRAKAFQKYFKIECIDKTFWISTNKTFSEKEIAAFADCEENYSYLVNLIKENKSHFRVIISALRLIKYFTTSKGKSKSLKKDFIEILKSDEVDIRIKCQIIECIEYLEFCKDDCAYQTIIFEIFKNESSKELNRRLLAILSNYEKIDEYFDYIKDEFLRDNEITKREITDEVRRGNNWILESLILRFKDADNFIAIIAYYFKDKYYVELSNEFAKNLKPIFLNFIKDESEVILRFFSLINNNKNYFKQEHLIRSIIIESGTQNDVTKYLLDNNQFSETYHFLAQLISSEGLNMVVEKYYQGSDESMAMNIEAFRNVMANTGKRPLAGNFNDLMIGRGFQFRDKFLTDVEIEKIQTELRDKPQVNFDILFNKKNLSKEIENIFLANEGLIDQKKINKIESNWYDLNGHWNTYINTPLLLLRSIVYRRRIETLSFEEFKTLIEDDFILFDEVKNSINRNKNSSIKFTVNQEQKLKIQEWCKESIKNIKFENMIKLHSVDSFTILPDYKTLKNILFFQDEFNFELPQSFLLDSIQFYGMENSHDDAGLDNLFEKINNKELFDKRIISNIKSKKLFSISLNKHIEYAINNNLIEAFETIREYLLDFKNNYINDNVFEKYIMLTQDYILLKELSSDIDNYICWVSIKLLTQNKKEKELCIQKSIAYLNQSNSKLYYSNALGILFHFNHPKAIEHFYSLISEDITPFYNGTEYANYTIENYELLENIFIAIYVDQEEKFKFGNHFNFFNLYVSNLSKNYDSYLKTQEVLIKLKEEMENRGSDSGIFYINQQIDNSKNSYINSKSKPMSFEEALKKVEEIIK